MHNPFKFVYQISKVANYYYKILRENVVPELKDMTEMFKTTLIISCDFRGPSHTL